MLRSLSDPSLQVEADRLARSRERVPEVEARARAGLVGRGRHHRRDLLGRQRVVVARDPRALPGQVLQEQRQLIAERAVQADLAVGAPRHLHALLQLLLVLGADRDRERRPQQRRAAGGLQVGEQVACLLRALIAEVGDALLAVGLRAHDLIGVLDPPPRDSQRQAVRQKARVQRQIDRRTAAISGGANISSTRAPGNCACSGSAPSTSCACQLVPVSDSIRSARPRCST